MNMQFQCVLNQFDVKILQLETLMLNHIEKKTRLFIYNFLFEMDTQNSKTLRYILKNSIYKCFFKIITLTTVFSLLNVSFIFLFSQETNRLESLWKCKQILVLLLTGKVTAGIRINFIGRYFWTWTDPLDLNIV